MPRELIEYVGVTEIGRWLGVLPGTVNKWRQRHEDFPEPDSRTGGQIVGWLPKRKDEILAWGEEHGRRT